ncbi:hypothetical protein PF008_g22328 [Phytophthora fragariae]|uniref:BED-type domain-containing protein n=1 Tax=Phytophthora fragariae TaxID=53985 RepID=A0A6G0QV01_9STRA|nr:hypothetical protein PF008_g22328 [Phytophthora fragariae]
MSLSSRTICNALFTSGGTNVFVCNTCNDTYRSSNGYSNLLNHLRRHHPAYEQLARSALREGNALQLRVVDQRTVDVYRWVEWIVVDKLPFSFCERPNVRANTKLSKINRQTVKIYVVDIADCVEARMKRDLPSPFGVVLDGWTHGGRHYLAIFAVFNGKREGAGVGTQTSADVFDDIHCTTRQFVLLAFCPLEDETDLGAQSVFDLLADTLSRYDRPWQAVTFMVGDNCSVNQSIVRKVGAVPFIGCASHRFNLAMKDYLAKEDALLEKIHALMKRFSTLKGRAVLRQVTPLAPVLRNATRWSSTYAMVERYIALEKCFRGLDHGTVSKHDLGSVFLSRREHDEAKTLLGDLARMEGVTKMLQRSTLTMSATRRLFNQVVQNYPDMKDRLSATAAIINYPALETGLVKIQRGENLNAAERTACASFRASSEPEDHEDGAEDHASIVSEAFKRRKVSKRAKYVDVSFVPPTSNQCERFFSAAKLQLTDLRMKMDAETIEKVMLLSFNRTMWDVYAVEMVRGRQQ